MVVHKSVYQEILSMNFNKYRTSLDKLNDENTHLRYMTLILGLVILLMIIFFRGKEVIITQQPPKLTEAVQVSKNNGDQPYKEKWALSFAELIGNLTPDSADFVISAMESYFDPTVYQSIKVSLNAQAETLKDEQATVTFSPKSIIYEPVSGIVYITGDQEIRSISVEPSRKTWTMEFDIKVVNYLPVVTHYDSYEGSPKTREVREREKRNKEVSGGRA